MADNKKEVERAFESTSVRISLNKKAPARRQMLFFKIKLEEYSNCLDQHFKHKDMNYLEMCKTVLMERSI